MEKEYLCPKCQGYLKVGDFIILLGKNKKKEKGLILLHPELGNYTSYKHHTFKIEECEQVNFYCPVCHVSLASDLDENLIHLILLEADHSFDIYFSRISGEKSTYLVNGDDVTALGEHSDRYTYFKLNDTLKQYLKR